MFGTNQFLAFSPGLTCLRPPLRLQRLDQRRCIPEPGFEVVPQTCPVGEVEAARILVLAKLYQVDPISDRCCGSQYPAQGLAAFVGLDHDINPLNTVQILSPLLLPGVRSRDAKSRDAVIPEGLRVALTLDQHDPPDLPDLL
jgi:hypothetical protein